MFVRPEATEKKEVQRLLGCLGCKEDEEKKQKSLGMPCKNVKPYRTFIQTPQEWFPSPVDYPSFHSLNASIHLRRSKENSVAKDECNK